MMDCKYVPVYPLLIIRFDSIRFADYQHETTSSLILFFSNLLFPVRYVTASMKKYIPGDLFSDDWLE